MTTATVSRPQYTLLQEYATQKQSPVDRTKGIIRGVKILGPESRNGRTYSTCAMSQVAKLAEGASVHINHDKNSPTDPPLESKFGALRNVRLERDGVRGDLHCNMSHPMWEQIAEAAEKFPTNFGLSINANGSVNRDRDGRPVVDDVDRLNSVDLVSSPATNSGLFESTVPARRMPSLREALLGAPDAKRPFLESRLREDAEPETDDELDALLAQIKASGNLTPEQFANLEARLRAGAADDDEDDPNAVTEDEDEMQESVGLSDDPREQERQFRRALGMPERTWGAYGGPAGGSFGPDLEGASASGAGDRSEVVGVTGAPARGSSGQSYFGAAGSPGPGNSGGTRPGPALESFVESLNRPVSWAQRLEESRDRNPSSPALPMPRSTAEFARLIN